jgi:hypothetical protein
MVNRVELAVLLVVFVLAWLTRDSGRWRTARRSVVRFSNHRALSITAVGLIGFVISAAGAALTWPEPRIHDEFSYLLAADTFASGRVANPPHPLWEFFETFHVNVQPTYGSIYPPGQGMFLAIGQAATGHPIVGVWLCFALASSAVCWMLQAYLPPRWALFGALLCAIRVGLLGSWAGQQGYWTQSYWGGAVAMLGGALAFGAVPRLARQPGVVNSILLGLGISVLAVSRPYEGLAATIPIALVVLIWFFRDRSSTWSVRLGFVALPLLVVLGATLAATAYYNYRVTGDPARLAYQQSAATYAVVPTFIWQSPYPEPKYRHDVIREYQVRWAGDRYAAKRSIVGFLDDLATRLREFTGFFLGIALMIPLVSLPQVLRDRWMRLAAAGCTAVALALCVTTWFQPHYAAPLTAPLFALIVQGLRYVRLCRWAGKPFGRVFVAAVPGLYAALAIVAVWQISQVPQDSWHVRRAELLRELESDGTRHLIIVRYGKDHDCTDEWVYNRADIDASTVVWARDMGPDRNQKLLDYFRDRRCWLLEVEPHEIRLKPYRNVTETSLRRGES